MIDIVIPVYRSKDSLKNIIENLLDQSFQNFRVLLVNDNPKSKSLADYCDVVCKNDDRFNHIKNEFNLGVIENLKKGLELVEAPFFTVIGDDDWRSADWLSICVSKLSENTIVMPAYYEVTPQNRLSTKHLKNKTRVFEKFSTRPQIRQLNYFLDSASYGKQNLLYGIIPSKNLGLVLEKLQLLSNKDIFFDEMFSFLFLSYYKVTFLKERLVTLTVNNEKGYERVGKYFILRRIINYLTLGPIYLSVLMSVLLPVKIIKSILARATLKILNAKTIGISNSKSKIQLDEVTLIAVSSVNVEETCHALKLSLGGIDFASTKLLSHYEPFNIGETIEFIRIEKLGSIDDWCKFIYYQLHEFVDTKHALLIHADGYVVSPKKFKSEFLQYDYIGSPWPLPKKYDKISYRANNGEIVRVGNSVSIRSKKIMELPSKLDLSWDKYNGNYHEDGFLTAKDRTLFLDKGIQYAPFEVALKFGRERPLKENLDLDPFVFHKWAGPNRKYPNIFKSYF